MPVRSFTALLLILPAAALAQEPILAGSWRLQGVDAGGRETQVRLTITLGGGSNEYSVQRLTRTKVPGQDERVDWGTASGVAALVPPPAPVPAASGATPVPAAVWQLEVTFKPTAGLAGGVSGAAPRSYQAIYQFDLRSGALSESLKNVDPAPGEWTTFTSQGQRDLDGKSYGELALEFLPTAWAHLEQRLLAAQAAHAQSPLLPHQVKDLRKEVLQTRELLDVFAYAFPRAPGYDLWADLRKELDRGYTRLGDFKDLFDAQGLTDPAAAVYDAGEVDAARMPAIEWLDAICQADHRAVVRAYLDEADRKRLFERDGLSDLFWGGAGVKPREDDSGLKTLGRLVRGQLEGSRKHLKELLDADGRLTRKQNEERFHGLRKLVRGALDVIGLVPQVVGKGNSSDELDLLEQVVDRMGELNDRLLAYHLAEQRNQPAEVTRIEGEVRDAWKQLRDWLGDGDVDHELKDLLDLIQH